MDATEQVAKFSEFFETLYYKELLDTVAKGHKHLPIPFSELAKYHVELAEDLLEDPENTLQAARHTIEQMDLGGDVKGFEVRFFGLPKTSHIMVRNIRSKHIGKFLELQGVVRQKSDVRPQVTSARFECPSCGNIIPVLQLDQKFKEPHACACGRKGHFRLIHKELVDAQKIVLEEATEDMDGGEQPKRLNIFLQNDLVSPISDRRTNPGSKIRLTGMVKEVPIILATGGKSTRFDLICECNHVEPVQEEFTNIVFSDEEVEQIKELAKRPDTFDHLTRSLAPTIYGHDKVKEALLLQLFAGVQKVNDDGVSRRGDIHILLIGDPGAGKCSRGDTKIILGDGSITDIASFAQDKGIREDRLDIAPQSLPSLGLNGAVESRFASRVWQRDAEELLRLRLRSGKVLHVTRNHPLFFHEHGCIVAKPADDFNVGESVASPRSIRVDGVMQSLDSSPVDSYHNCGFSYSFPAILDDRFARLLGYWCGDGHLSLTKTSAWVSFTNNDGDVLVDYAHLFSTFLGREPTLRASRQGKSAQEYYVLSRGLFRRIRQEFPELCSTSRGKSIPQKILRSPDMVLASFLKGLFECDAHVNVSKRQVEFTTISENLAQEVQLSLLRFGIIAVLKEKSRYATNSADQRRVRAFEIIISGESYDAFAKHIGFHSASKSRALESALHRTRNTNIDLVPDVGGLLFLVRRHLGLRQSEMGIIRSTYAHFEQGNRKPSVRTLRRIATHLARTAPDDWVVQSLVQFAEADVFWDEIVSKQVIPHGGMVYDLEVPTTHNYVANGVIIHNSQLVKRMSIVAPKSRFVSGKGASGAGLTASVVKDEFLKGWALEAGTLVLANKGMACIDEMDKMSDEDTSAMHEALEQQCYAYDTPLLFADGSERLIGEYVEEQFATHPDDTYEGHNCILLKDGVVSDSLLSTDFRSVSPQRITRVSKHKSSSFLHKITYALGRSITVTPEHPVFVVRDGRIVTVRADEVLAGDCVPVPRKLPIPGEIQVFSTLPEDVFNPRSSQHITVPEHNDASLYRLVGHLVAEGSVERNRGKIIGVNFTNKDERLLEDVRRCVLEVFGLKPYEQYRVDDHDPRLMLRFISRELAVFLEREMPELLVHAPDISIPSRLIRGRREDIANLLLSLFEGDGHVAVKERTIRIGYGSSSRRLVEQVQDLLLRFSIRSSITHHRSFWKVNVTGYDNVKRFADEIGFLHPLRQAKVEQYLATRSSTVRTSKDILHGAGKRIVDILRRHDIRRVGKTSRATIVHDYLRKGAGISRLQAARLLDELKGKELDSSEQEFANLLEGFAHGDISFDRVTRVEREESEHPWTYDVTIEPNHTFISGGVVLHNTVSISKANIQATLKCQTTVLAAANPKFGRFDPYELIAKQINLPEPLINRFDLIFPMKDLPNPDLDNKMASFILNLHRGSTEVKDESLLSTEFVRKYIAYAKQHVKPELTDDALDEIRKYYVQMRNQGGEGSTSAVPISARQLEALVRLAEASARSRLWPKVTKSDAQRAIDLVHHCLSQIGVDPETGKFDIDRITTGITARQRSDIGIVKEVLSELENAVGKIIPEDDIVREAEIKGVAEDKVNEILTKLTRQGDLFMPKNGFYSKVR